MSETTFENVKKGDRVYSTRFGWGYVFNINNITRYPIEYKADSGILASFTLEGFEIASHKHQSLFWNKPIAPPRPKRKMSKTVERFISESVLDRIKNKNDLNPSIWGCESEHAYIPIKITYEWEE